MFKLKGKTITPHRAAKEAVLNFGTRTEDMGLEEYIYIFDEGTKPTERELARYSIGLDKALRRLYKMFG